MPSREATPAPGVSLLFESLGPDEFLRDYWLTRPLVHHGDPARLGLSEVGQLKGIEPLLASHTGATKALFTDAAGQHVEVPYAAERALAPYRLGTPLCLGGLEHSIEEIDAWRSGLLGELGVPPDATTCGAFAAPPGAIVPRHFDNREVIVVQLVGRKRWTLAPNPDVSNPTQSYGPALCWNWSRYAELGSYYDASDAEKRPRDEVTIDMKPGSAMFLPRGFWHVTQALEDSLSLTFSFCTPSFLDLLLAEVRSRLVGTAEWREPLAPSEAELRRKILEAIGEQVGRWADAREGVTNTLATDTKRTGKAG